MRRRPPISTLSDTLFPYTLLFRLQDASVIDVASERLFFTSGATESVNWALKGAISAPGQTRRRLVTIATEHACVLDTAERSEEHTSELQSLMRISYDVFCLKKKTHTNNNEEPPKTYSQQSAI